MSRQEGRYIDVNLLGDITKTVDGVPMVRYDDIMEITPIEVIKNEIECDECCVSYDTAVQREQDAYDSGFEEAIERVLAVIDKLYYTTCARYPTVEYVESARNELRMVQQAVLVLKGERE